MDGDGAIDFQDFITVCLNRKVLVDKKHMRTAFQIIDADKNGKLTYSDFEKLFNSYDQYGGAKMDQELWQQLLKEADRNGDGMVSFEEFSLTMKDMVRKSWLRVQDRSISPSKSCSPSKFSMGDQNSPLKTQHTPSPTKHKRNGGQIVSPERNPFKLNDLLNKFTTQ